jgi:BCD family chlorophyll transporter-like MFS transporter
MQSEAHSSIENQMGWLAILQVSLVNIAVGLMILPLNSILNRVMINELGLSATLVALLISLRFITSPSRIWFGRLSDTHPVRGLHRTWYILIGAVLMAAGLISSAYVALSMSRLGILGIILAFLSFGLLGLGVNLTTPLYFALVADQSNERQRPRIVASMFVLLGISAVISSFAIGRAVEPYTETRLIQVLYGTAIIALVLTILGLVKLERRTRPGESERADAPLGTQSQAVRDLLLKNTEALRFFVYLLLAFVAVEAQEVILEPYGAQMFQMTPGETTRLTGIMSIASLLMLAVGAFLVNRIGHKPTASIGVGVACAGLVLIISSGLMRTSALFTFGVFTLGLGSGLLTITNLALMINMTDDQHAGIFMGAWGFAQAIGVGSGNILGGLLRDLGLAVFGNQLASYLTVYAIEIALLAAALPVLWGLSVVRFHEINQHRFPMQPDAARAK